MGPFTEQELQGKTRSGEITDSAYVFTEGMSDWASLAETPVLKASPGSTESETPEMSLSDELSLGSGTFEQVPDTHSDEPGVQIEKVGASAPTQQISTEALEAAVNAAHTPEAVAKKKARLRLLMFVAVLALLGALAWQFMSSNLLMDAPRQEVPEELPPPEQALNGAASKDGAASMSADLGTIWSELGEMNRSEDRNGPPFRIASKTLSGQRPVVLGSFSKLIQASALSLAVYPDPANNLMTKPRVWVLDVPVVDGYFAAGPFTEDGGELPPGTYKVMAQTKGTYLGTVSFDIAGWPAGDELSKRQAEIQARRASVASDERAKLEALFRNVDAAFEELRTISAQSAVQGPIRRKQWLTASRPWQERFRALGEQTRPGADYSFYFETQNRLNDFSRNVNRVYGLMGVFSQKGKVAFEAAAKKKYAQVWADISKERDLVKGEIQTLGTQPLSPPSLNEDLLKKLLLER